MKKILFLLFIVCVSLQPVLYTEEVVVKKVASKWSRWKCSRCGRYNFEMINGCAYCGRPRYG